jgi:prepilin-type processing-associated H-X9-DG protein
MEERGLYNAYNMALACCAPHNGTAVAGIVKSFVCPSNPRFTQPLAWSYYIAPPATVTPGSVGVGNGPGPTDYVFSVGAVGLFTCVNPFVINTSAGLSGHPGNMKASVGAFNVNSSVRIDTIKDGTSNTILMGESVGGAELYVGAVSPGGAVVNGSQEMRGLNQNAACDQPWSQGYIGGPPAVSSGGSGGFTTGNNGGFGSVFGATAWNAWFDGNRIMTDPNKGANWFPYPINEAKNRYARPTWIQDDARPTPGVNLTGPNGANLPGTVGSTQGFRSYHTSMAQFLFGDGSVKSINENTDAKVLAAMSTVVGREPTEQSE